MKQAETSAGFTPGPWSLRDTPWAEGRKHYIQGPRGRALATTLSMESADPKKKAEVEANARLIAAAPSLYLALVEAVCELRADLRGENDWKDTAAVVTKAQTALAKARGDQ